MRILFLTRRFYPDIGGVEKHVLNISERLLATGHSIVILAEQTSTAKEGIYELYKSKKGEKKPKWQMRYISDKGTGRLKSIDISGQSRNKKDSNADSSELRQEERLFSGTLFGKNDSRLSSTGTDSIIVYRLPKVNEGRAKKVHIWMWLLKNRFLLKSADVVHCHDVFYWYLPFKFLYPRKEVYTTFHGYESYPIKLKAIVVRKISEVLSSGNICIGDFIKKWYSTKPTFVSYGGVDVGDFRQKKPNDVSAVFIGRLDEQTGILTYAETVNMLLKKYPKFSFTVVGEGVFRQSLKQQFTVEKFTQHIEPYLESNRYAFISRYLGILESMAAKRLVFAVYDNPVKKDYLSLAPFAPWIVIAGTAGELESKVEYYLKHPEEEKEMVDKAYKWVKNQTWENVTSLYLQLWQAS